MYPDKQFPEDVKARLDSEWCAWRRAVTKTIARLLSETNQVISEDTVLAQGLGQVIEVGSTVGYNTEVMTQALTDLDIANGRDLAEFLEAQTSVQDALDSATKSQHDVVPVAAHPGPTAPDPTSIPIDPVLLALDNDHNPSVPRFEELDGAPAGLDPPTLVPVASASTPGVSGPPFEPPTMPADSTPPAKTVQPVVRNELAEAWASLSSDLFSGSRLDLGKFITTALVIMSFSPPNACDRFGHVARDNCCPRCGKVMETKTDRPNAASANRLHLNNCLSMMALEENKEALLAKYPSSLDTSPLVLARSKGGAMTLNEAFERLTAVKYTLACAHCPATFDHPSPFRAHLVTEHGIWVPIGVRKGEANYPRYQALPWGLEKARFPARYFHALEGYVVDPEELER